MKNIDKKISTLIEVVNKTDPSNYFKFKFQDFCADMFFSIDENGIFAEEEDYVSIFNKVNESNIILDGPNKDLLLKSFSFGILSFYSYVDFCFKTSYITRKNMKKFCTVTSDNYFNENFPDFIFEYYRYIKRKGNSSLEQETINQVENKFTFFKDLAEFQFSFQAPNNEEEDDEYEDGNKSANIGESIKNSYGCYVNTICLSFSTFLNYLNSISITN